MSKSGVISRGVKTPIIKQGDDLAKVVVSSVLQMCKEDNVTLKNKDVICITEAVVGISKGNYATVDQIGTDVKSKFKTNHLGILFPILSRNRFSIMLKAFARAFDKITIMMSYPKDEVGNSILDEKKLRALKINPYTDVISESKYKKEFGDFKHPFTGVNMVDEYRKVCESENCKVDFVLANNPLEIIKYTKDILVCSLHERFNVKEDLSVDKSLNVYSLDDILNKPVQNSGYNTKYGLLGANAASVEKVKLFPNEDMSLLTSIQEEIKKAAKVDVEVMIYGDGAFKDPVGQIWELADPVVSPFYTKGLEGSPNEVKIKFLVDNKFAHLSGDALSEAIKNEIKNKDKNLVGQDVSLGTTPRRYTDLLGSLCDLTSGSGDRGTPVILIQNYFTNYTD